MSKSKKDQEFWRLRKLAKKMGSHGMGTSGLNMSWRETKEYSELNQEFERIWNKYGTKSMVMDQRRRCSTRKGNQALERKLSRIRKLREKRIAIKNMYSEMD